MIISHTKLTVEPAILWTARTPVFGGARGPEIYDTGLSCKYKLRKLSAQIDVDIHWH